VIGAPFLITRLTDSNGYFEADGLPAGVYFVSERLEAAPPGWIATTSTEQILLVQSGSLGVANFGNAVFGEICGYKFYDKDLDGTQDLNEPGLGGWTITLTGLTTQGVAVSRTVLTGEDGFFCFEDLQPGTYQVDEVLMPGWQATVELPIEIDVSGAMVYFEIGVEIGNIQYAKICGYKFLDTYENQYPFWPNGLFDPDEFGIGNWIITLQGRTTEGDLVNRVAYTDNDGDLGHYCFENLLPGTYWVNETLLQGFYATRPIANLVVIPAHPIGPVFIRIDFGNLLPSPDPEINFVMKAGWNLWSSPIKVTGLTAKSLLQKIGPNGLVVTMLDKTTGKYKSYVAGDPDKFDFPIELGKGYYVWVDQDAAFTMVGVLEPTEDIPVDAGWNILGYSQLEPMMASELLNKVSGTNGWILVELDHTGKYRSYVSGDPAKFDFVVSPGKAYYLWVDGAGSIAY
jgi:hypothetical protein